MRIGLDKRYWREVADKELKDALSHTWNVNTAKNVIIFVGDGMSPDTITASRIYRKGESSYLAWERFPHVGLLKVRATLTTFGCDFKRTKKKFFFFFDQRLN